jgi:excisionase family DNA binding protein
MLRQDRTTKLVTIREFCTHYRISHRTVWNWVRTGRLKALRDAGGRIFRLIDPQWPVLDESGDPDLVMRLAVLKPFEVAVLLGVLPSTVRKMNSQGRLRAVWVGSQRRYSLAEVRRVIAERALGHGPRNRRENSVGMLRWATWKLGLRAADGGLENGALALASNDDDPHDHR